MLSEALPFIRWLGMSRRSTKTASDLGYPLPESDFFISKAIFVRKSIGMGYNRTFSLPTIGTIPDYTFTPTQWRMVTFKDCPSRHDIWLRPGKFRLENKTLC